jgi:hypothetical protein
MFMILCVVDDPHKVNNVMEAWRNAGVAGITIVESTGLHRVEKVPRIPMPYLLSGVESERGNITLLTVVDDEAMVQRCLEAAESVVGDFNSSNTGMFAAWPLTFVKGAARKNHTGNS